MSFCHVLSMFRHPAQDVDIREKTWNWLTRTELLHQRELSQFYKSWRNTFSNQILWDVCSDSSNRWFYTTNWQKRAQRERHSTVYLRLLEIFNWDLKNKLKGSLSSVLCLTRISAWTAGLQSSNMGKATSFGYFDKLTHSQSQSTKSSVTSSKPSIMHLFSSKLELDWT